VRNKFSGEEWDMRRLLTTVAAAAMAVGFTAASAPGHPPGPHRHCLLTPQGWVEIAPGVVEHPKVHETAFHNVHGHVHVGAGNEGPLTIMPVFDLNAGCP
jgi:hypothetical protein